MAVGLPQRLSEADFAHFQSHGWIKIPSCFTAEAAAHFTRDVWTRLGISPTDKSTWGNGGRTNMPAGSYVSAKDFAPKAWQGICDLLGGEERVAPESAQWGDGFIVNMGTREGEGKPIPGNQLKEWHVDGDFFVHYLDSPEQGLLVIPLFTDIKPGGGGTFLLPNGIGHVARHLYDHPEGVSPRMTPRAQNPTFDADNEDGLSWYNSYAAKQPISSFVEATGDVGDVYLLHPLMMHTASNNSLHSLRIITNPPVGIRQPFEFDREDGQYSPVEQKTLRELSKARLDGWKIGTPRERLVPKRIQIQEKMREEEGKRLTERNIHGTQASSVSAAA